MNLGFCKMSRFVMGTSEWNGGHGKSGEIGSVGRGVESRDWERADGLGA